MNEKKTKTICFTLTESEYNELKERATADRRPLAQFVGLLVVDCLEAEKRKEERNAKTEKLRDSIPNIEG